MIIGTMRSFVILFLGLIVSFTTQSAFGQTADVTQGCVPLNVNFTSPGVHPTYYWDFDGAGSSNLQNPSPVFLLPGTYNVTFRETAGGPIIGSTIQITVFADPVLTITSPSGCAPLNSTLTATVTKDPAITISSYTWFFGDGGFSNGASASTSHTYSANGTYDVSVQTFTNFPTCDNTYNFLDQVEVIQGPTASFTTNPVSLTSCNNTLNNVAFTNTSTGSKPFTYSWNMGNGNTSTAQNPPNQNYTGPGVFVISLNVNYTGYTGCSASATKQVSLGKPTVDLTQSSDKICVGSSANFSSTTTGTYAWSFGSGASPATSSSANNTVTYSTPGTKTVVLTVTNGTCTSTKITTILVDQVTASFTTNPTFLCDSPGSIAFAATSNQSNVKYIWTFTHGTKTIIDSTSGKNVSKVFKSYLDSIYYSQNFNLPYSGEIISSSLVIKSNATGCFASASHIDTMWLPNARFAVNKYHGCAPLTVQFNDSSHSFNPIVQWKWVYDDAGATTTNPNRNSVSHTYNTPGTYYAKLVVTSQKGCIDTSYAVKIEVGSDLSAQLNFTASQTTVCIGQPVTISSSISAPTMALIDAYHYYGEGSRVSHCGALDDVTWTFDDTVGTLPVTLQVDYNGCMSSLTKNNFITVNGARAKIYYTALCSSPLEYNFESRTINEASSLLTWNFDDGSPTMSSDLAPHIYGASGDYMVTLQADADGCTHKDSVLVKARNINASFTTPAPPLLCINQAYTFNATSATDVYTDCYSGYTWEFPTIPSRRPSNRPTATPQFTFPSAGLHYVKLVVKDVNGCIDSTKHWVRVFDMNLNATISDNSICNPTTVNFTSTSTGDTTLVNFDWAFGDGQIGNGLNESNTYTVAPLAGFYNVTLTVTDKLGCVENRNFTIFHYTPTSTISIADATLCVGDSTDITATDFTSQGSNLSYSWNFGNSTTSNVKTNNVKYMSANNAFVVTLNYTEVSSGCSGTTTSAVNVQSYPIADITSNPVGPDICGVQVVFSDNSTSPYPLSYSWDFGNGQTSAAATFGPSYVDGSYTISHIVSTSNGCKDTATPKLIRLNNPLGTFNANKTTICKGDSVQFSLNNDTSDIASFQWSFGDGTFADDVNPVYHTYAFNPNNNVFPAALILRAFQPPGCTFQKLTNINVHRVTASFDRLTEATDNDTAMCMSELPYVFTNTSVGVAAGTDVFSWRFGDALTSTTYSPTHQYSSSGVYSVELYTKNNALGCEDSITKQIVLFDNPIVNTTTDTACLGNAVNMQVTNVHAGSTYLWTPATGLNDPTSTTPQATIVTPRTYLVTETDLNGCTDTSTVNAIVVTPLILANFDTTIIVGDRIPLPAAKPDYYTFTWDPTDGLSCLDCDNPKVRPLDNIIYTLTVTDDKNCFNDTYTFDITVLPETTIKFPTMFTPNGDGSNDIIYVKGWGIKELLEFKIFNRWGQLIYESTNINEGWDGKFKGEFQNTDVYAYKVTVGTWLNTELTQEGYFNLIR